ncbi:MAG TPA: hypothetical protein VEI80_07330 [Candidatus Acidoferrales bacterium]|nr:hypothetical protein [Candidatus Acidoferrales bacterium]
MSKSRRLLPSVLAAVLLITLASLSIHGVTAQAYGDFSIGLSNSTVTIAQGSYGTVNLYVAASNEFAQTVSLSLSGPSGVAASFNGNGPSQIATAAGATTSTSVTLYVDDSVAPGTYPLSIIGTSPSGLAHAAALQLVVTPAGTTVSAPSPDFVTQPSPSVMTLTPGVSKSTTVVFSSVNGFSSVVSLSAAWTGVAPDGVTISLPTPVTIPAGGSATSILTLTASDAPSTGTYTLTITATNGVLAHTSDIAVTITGTPSVLAPVAAPDFTISSILQPSPATMTLGPDTSQSATITLSPIDGLASTVSLSASWSGVAPAGVSVNLPSPVAVPASGSASSTLTLSADSSPSAGTYTLVVTASNGILTHITTIPVTIAGTLAILAPVTPAVPAPVYGGDFTIAPTSDTVSTTPGLNSATAVTVNSVNGFSAPVTFSASWVGNAPTGIGITLPPTVTPPVGGEASSPIGFTTTALSSSGTYVVQVTGTGGGVSHSTDITLLVNQPGPFAIQPGLNTHN